MDLDEFELLIDNYQDAQRDGGLTDRAKARGALKDAFAALEAERDALRKLLRECDDYLMCVEQQSMSRNNAESLASELRAAIAARRAKC